MLTAILPNKGPYFLMENTKTNSPNGEEKMSLELIAFGNFVNNYYDGKCGTQRFGQAFWDYFKLDKMSNKERFGNLYNVEDDQKALQIINDNFVLS